MTALPESWLAARGTNRFIKRGNVGGWDLRGADFTDIRLERVDASRSNLSQSRWQNFRGLDCNFTGANFVGADLSGARFMDCLLSEANLAGCLLEDAMLAACMLNASDLAGAVLSRTDLGGSSFVAAHLANAELVAVKAKQANFDDADLTNADLRRGNFERASFLRAKLEGVNWEGAILTGAEFDLGTGNRMLEAALLSCPNHPLPSLVGCECSEGARIWYVIERREDRSAILRIDELTLKDGRLEVVFERLDRELKSLPAYALIAYTLLRDLLGREYWNTSNRITFKEPSSNTSFALPG